MISSHRVTPILILCIGLFRKYVAWEKGERRWRSSKKISRVNFSMIFFSLTQLNLYFCLASHQALIISQSATKRAHPRRSLPVYLKYLYNTWDLSESIIIPLLCLCGLFTIHVYQKIQLCLKMWFSISFDNYNVIHWSKKSYLLSFDSFLVEFSE